MKSLFEVKITAFKDLKEIEGAWTHDHYFKILEELEYSDIDGMSESDIIETCIMLLQDQEPEDAALILLKLRLGDKLKEGQLKNVSNEMLDEKLWEEYAEPAFHEELFNIASLLYKVAPNKFPKPDAVELDFDIKGLNEKSADELKDSCAENFILNVLASAMDKNAIIHRLYGEQLENFTIEEASKILWTLGKCTAEDGTVSIKLISSGYWLDSLKGIDTFESNAHPS
jgi:hypothetical protein